METRGRGGTGCFFADTAAAAACVLPPAKKQKTPQEGEAPAPRRAASSPRYGYLKQEPDGEGGGKKGFGEKKKLSLELISALIRVAGGWKLRAVAVDINRPEGKARGGVPKNASHLEAARDHLNYFSPSPPKLGREDGTPEAGGSLGSLPLPGNKKRSRDDFYTFPEKKRKQTKATRAREAEARCAPACDETFPRWLLPVASMYSMHLSMKMGMGFSGVTTLVKGTPK